MERAVNSSRGYTGGVPFYEKWTKSEGIPVIDGYYVEDLNKVPVEPWHRKGGLGAFVNLEGNEELNDAYVCEIAPGKSLKPQKHLYEEIILILSGKGTTAIWNETGSKQTVEWHEWSLFAIPLNVWHQHFNGQGDRPARYVAVTAAPMVFNMFHNLDFVFKNNFVFTDRYIGEPDYFTRGEFTAYPEAGRHGDNVWESNFIPDVRIIKLHPGVMRGGENRSQRMELANNTLSQHISEFDVGTYKKAHSHGPAANIVILNGTGYSLLWPEGKPHIKIDWHQGSMLVPPNRWLHQHFNTGPEPARYLAIGIGTPSPKHPFGKIPPMGEDFSLGLGYGQIEYEDEAPEIRKLFEEELRKKGVQIKMPPVKRRR